MKKFSFEFERREGLLLERERLEKDALLEEFKLMEEGVFVWEVFVLESCQSKTSKMLTVFEA